VQIPQSKANRFSLKKSRKEGSNSSPSNLNRSGTLSHTRSGRKKSTRVAPEPAEPTEAYLGLDTSIEKADISDEVTVIEPCVHGEVKSDCIKCGQISVEIPVAEVQEFSSDLHEDQLLSKKEGGKGWSLDEEEAVVVMRSTPKKTSKEAIEEHRKIVEDAGISRLDSQLTIVASTNTYLHGLAQQHTHTNLAIWPLRFTSKLLDV